jgi:type II secretion system protein N
MAMNQLTRLLLKFGGYALFALVVFIIFVYVTFPYEKLKYRIEQHALASGDLELTIGELGPSPLTGLSAEHVQVIIKPKANSPGVGPSGQPAAKGKDKGPKSKRLVLDEVVVKLGLLGLIRGGTDVDFQVSGLGGELEGSYSSFKKEGWAVHLEAEGLDLGRLPAIGDLVGLPVAGTLALEADLTVPQHRLSNASGFIDIRCDRCSIGDGKAKLKVPGNALLAMGITMPRIKLGSLGGRVQIDKGEGTLQHVSAKSPDVELDLEGRFSLRNPMSFSNADAYLKFKISPQLKKRDPKFEMVENGLANAKRADGYFGMRVMGPLKNLRFIPSKLGPAKGPGPGRQGPGRRPGSPGQRPFRRFPAHGRAPAPGAQPQPG